jgi:hypothetical protein
VVPDEQAMRAAASMWAGGEPPTYEGHATGGVPSGDQPLTRVAMAWLDNESEVRALAGDAELFAKRFPGADPADVDLVAADYTAARADALARIADGTAGDRTWARLVVVHGRACADPERSPLVRTPELVRAVIAHQPSGLDPLLALLSRYEAGTSMSDSIRR